MSKRINQSTEKPPQKRARGFRLARSNPEATVPTSSTLFVTVNAQEERAGTLTSQSRLISRTVDSSSNSLSPTPDPGFEPENDVAMESSAQMEDLNLTPQSDIPPDIPPKPKRQRYTTNVVSRAILYDCIF